MGLCFVEPDAIGRGVGRALYSHVMRAARELGFTRITIDSDPNAEPFYRRMGARPVGRTPSGSTAGRELPVLEVLFATRRDSWVDAWTQGRRAVHFGNVAEFQAQFGPASAEAAHYSCLAAFISAHPAVLILPRAVPPDWIDMVGDVLGWGTVEVYDGLAEVPTRGLSDAVLSRPALVERLKSLGLPLVPWGRTPDFAELAGEPLPPDALRYESKRAAHELFTRLAPDPPGIRVPEQWQAATRRAAARLLRTRGRAGRTTVVKTEHGAGGSGTWVIRNYRFPSQLPRGPLLLEEFVAGETGETALRDLTSTDWWTRKGTSTRWESPSWTSRALPTRAPPSAPESPAPTPRTTREAPSPRS